MISYPIHCLWGQIALPKASSGFQQSFKVVQASVVKRERIRALSSYGSAESHELFMAHGRKCDVQSLSFLMKTVLSGLNIIEYL